MEVAISPRKQFKRVSEAVCEALEEMGCVMTPSILIEKIRNKDRVMGRHVCMLIMRDYHGMTLHTIARFLGGMDHSSVVYGHKKCFDMVEHDVDYSKLFCRTVEILCLPPLPYIKPKEQPSALEVLEKEIKVDKGHYQKPVNWSPEDYIKLKEHRRYPGMKIRGPGEDRK
jgi:hypothetical protein